MTDKEMCGLKDKADVDTFPGIVREELLPVHEDDRKGVEVCVCMHARARACACTCACKAELPYVSTSRV